MTNDTAKHHLIDVNKPIQSIVEFMNSEPSKLFGGKYNSFWFDKEKIHAINWDKDNIGEFVTYYTFHDTRLLRELAKAKWGDKYICSECEDSDSLVYEQYDKEPTYIFCEGCEQDTSVILKSKFYFRNWCDIEDEAKLIETIANDILS